MLFQAPIGIEVGPKHLRALRLSRARRADPAAMEVEWDAAAPADAVAALRERFGPGARLAVALDVSALFVKRLPLPTLAADERRRLVALDPERYFPVREETLVVGVRDDDLVVAAREEAFDRLMDALEALGAVERVEPAPVALARHLAASAIADAVVVMTPEAGAHCAVVAVRQGRVESIRKLPAGAPGIAAALPRGAEAATPGFLYPWLEEVAQELARAGLSVRPVPAPPGSVESFAGARGALLGLEGPGGLLLASPALERREQARGRRRGMVAVAALVAALAVALWAVDARRARTLVAVEQRLAALRDRAGELQRLQADVASASQELVTLATVARQRPDPLDVLLRTTQLLPPDAHLRELHAKGDDWELDGYARDAARLIPTFAADSAFADVRFRAATSRAQVGAQNYENFSLALRRVRATH